MNASRLIFSLGLLLAFSTSALGLSDEWTGHPQDYMCERLIIGGYTTTGTAKTVVSNHNLVDFDKLAGKQVRCLSEPKKKNITIYQGEKPIFSGELPFIFPALDSKEDIYIDHVNPNGFAMYGLTLVHHKQSFIVVDEYRYSSEKSDVINLAYSQYGTSLYVKGESIGDVIFQIFRDETMELVHSEIASRFGNYDMFFKPQIYFTFENPGDYTVIAKGQFGFFQQEQQVIYQKISVIE